MARALVFLIGCCLLLGSCTQRSICPAYQSAYIYDQEALRKKFSYFLGDSTPKVLTASKNRYLVAEPTPYRKKLRHLRTVEMKPVPVHVPDSIASKDSVSSAALDRAARSVIDSTFIPDLPARQQAPAREDSIYVISKDRELRLLKYNGADSLEYDPVSEKYVAQKPKYYVKDVGLNTEQDNYMWYLRDYLVLPDVRLIKNQQAAEAKQDRKTSDKKARKGLKGFFKNLFKKKDKAADSIDIAPPPQEEFDFIDSDTLTRANPLRSVPEARKGLLASRKKKSPARATTTPAVNLAENRRGEPIKEQEEGGGF